ncbi:nucleotidyltransferase domain protein [Thermosulfidibacter takaii ABI70S6]|uniref:Nucleotidyltransferase domain protein n=1 Tax=Thermosulfidibacter takaii (strain DSM 17441 / JCM 13301 / NBRC 103674 / ABI70S6) TaxID=1298851 RepID=A0A0S3QRY4_THET7|nr:nucleotidyltransferase domain-containing protein [Thermosulfidibacter takaii]BAT71080.1 nucleotidyltransferase domain protein [Thermosulfidibacter takaii ABI70S6]
MPVRSLNTCVLKWVTKEEIEKVLMRWAEEVKKAHPEVKRIGYFGSYARGDWGVGSDLDVIIVVEKSDEPFIRRPLSFDITEFPVCVDLLVYTEEELEKLKGTGFYGRVIEREVVWVLDVKN